MSHGTRPHAAVGDTSPTATPDTSTDAAPPPASRRIIGIDAARGLALVGMVAVHVMPASNGEDATLVWQIGSGTSAALFSFIAGVSIALSAGGPRGLTRPERGPARMGLAVRAVLIGVIGLLLAVFNPPAGIILTYYGVMFLLAVPLLTASAGTLFALAAAFGLFGSLFLHLNEGQLPGLQGYDPSLGSLFTDPDATLSAVLFTGTFPAVTWMAYVCAGLAVGRLDLRSRDVRLRMLVSGVLLASITWAVAKVSTDVLGGFERILWQTRGMTDEELERALTWGTEHAAPEITSGWWLLVLSPYEETPMEVFHTLGIVLAVFASMLLLGARVRWLVRPLALLGIMTLTLYAAHLVFLSTHILASHPVASFWIQLGMALLLVVLWRNISEGRPGPLEWVVRTCSHSARRWYRDRRSASRSRS